MLQIQLHVHNRNIRALVIHNVGIKRITSFRLTEVEVVATIYITFLDEDMQREQIVGDVELTPTLQRGPTLREPVDSGLAIEAILVLRRRRDVLGLVVRDEDWTRPGVRIRLVAVQGAVLIGLEVEQPAHVLARVLVPHHELPAPRLIDGLKVINK